jgi:CheY-like chemotaxis protein
MALKILAVDDSKMIRMLIKKTFKPFNCDVIEAENGVDGLAAALREKPDIIILDVNMPVMKGDEMLAKLRNEHGIKDIPVIMLTAEAVKENISHITDMVVTDYILKPFKGEQLIESAKKVIKLEL